MTNGFLTPWRRNGLTKTVPVSRLQNEFDRAFQEFFETFPVASAMDFNPSCELTEDPTGYSLKFDVPGVKKEDVKIELTQNVLTVSAERKQEKATDTKKQHYSEISYGSYRRSFSLPSEVDEKKVDAKFENGVLTVKLPKSETSKAKQISIQ